MLAGLGNSGRVTVCFLPAGWNELLIASFSHRSIAVKDGILLATGLHVHRNSAHSAGVGAIFDRWGGRGVSCPLPRQAVSWTAPHHRMWGSGWAAEPGRPVRMTQAGATRAWASQWAEVA